MAVTLYDYQQKAVDHMHNGCILCGDTGCGKSLTSLAYYLKTQEGKDISQRTPLYVITTATKRDKHEWEGEMRVIDIDPETAVVDSWNNIGKYVSVKHAFFIFDEHKATGTKKWARRFIAIAKQNEWILLSATPGDKWKEYAAVFIANGFYKTFSEFDREHVVYEPHTNWPQIRGYLNKGKLLRYRAAVLVDVDYYRKSELVKKVIDVEYNRDLYKDIWKNRWDYEKNEPIDNATRLCGCVRKVVNSDPSRIARTLELAASHHRVIIFYTFNYELDILKSAPWVTDEGVVMTVAEWNGHHHEPIPDCDNWVYLVQYMSGAEGWNCIKTDTMIFYSQTYSYKGLKQACGRIDRANTPYKTLYYYHLVSKAPIDLAISKALKQKKQFNDEAFVKGIY